MPIRLFFQLLSAEITRQRAAAVSVTRAQSALKVDVVASIVGPPKTGVEVVTSRRNLIEAIKIPPFQSSKSHRPAGQSIGIRCCSRSR
ncbi:hypothetical protein ACSS6W_005242 [Trichoderma asperelloides]